MTEERKTQIKQLGLNVAYYRKRDDAGLLAERR